jgi:hypothetical protein
MNDKSTIQTPLSEVEESKDTNSLLEVQKSILELPEKVTIPWLIKNLTLQIWATIIGVLIAVGSIGVGVGQTTFYKELTGQKQEPKVTQATTTRLSVDKALLRLHIYNDQRQPERLTAENIFRWYHLKTIAVLIDPKTGRAAEQVFNTTLFVSFDSDVRIGTLQARSPDMTLPQFEVKEFNQRYAIVVFSGLIPEGTLEITVVP